LAGLHFELRFEISQSGPTAAATNCEKGKTGAKRRDKKFTLLFENFHPLRPRFDVFKVPKRGRSGGTKKSKKNRDFCQSGNENGG
jgi:hypothetical protein